MAPEYRSRLLAALLVTACLLPSLYSAWTWRGMPELGQYHDDSVYWLNAKSLAEGSGYRITSLPEQPYQTKYPPLLPWYLSLVWRMVPRFPANLPLATLFCWLWVPAWLAVSWRVLRDMGLERGPALGLCAFLALSPVAVKFSLMTGAEMMCSVLWMSSVALVSRGRPSARMAAAAGVLGGAAYLAKTAALPLLVAVPLWFAVRRDFRRALAFAAAMLPAVAGWNLWMRAHLARGSDPLLLYYTDYFRYQLYNVDLHTVPSLLLKNFLGLLQSTGELLVGSPGFVSTDYPAAFAAATLAMLTIGVLALAGCVRRARAGGLTLYDVFGALYVVLLLVWHYPPNERFLFPLMPVLLAGCWHEARALRSLLRNRARAMAAVTGGIAAAVCVWTGAGWFYYFRFLDTIAEVTRANAAVYSWISRNTPADAKFLAYDDVLLYLHTGRAACRPVVPTRYFYEEDAAGVERFVGSLPALARSHGLGYILAAPRDWHGEILPAGLARRTHAMLAAAGLPAAYESGDVTLFRVVDAVNSTLPADVPARPASPSGSTPPGRYTSK